MERDMEMNRERDSETAKGRDGEGPGPGPPVPIKRPCYFWYGSEHMESMKRLFVFKKVHFSHEATSSPLNVKFTAIFRQYFL
jgi:hypothetical protein